MLSFERGKWCRFRLADAVCPDKEQILNQITEDMSVSGAIMFLSDRGQQSNRFAIVEVDGILSPLIVPVEHLKSADKEDGKKQRMDRSAPFPVKDLE